MTVFFIGASQRKNLKPFLERQIFSPLIVLESFGKFLARVYKLIEGKFISLLFYTIILVYCCLLPSMCSFHSVL